MAITAQTRTELVQLVVSMLGEAPSTAMLTDLVTKANAGSTVQELADSLASNAAFTSQFPVWMTATEFTTKVVANMFAGSSVSQADTDAAVDYIAGAITAGTFTKTSAVVALTSYLASADGVANATYGSAAQSYQNKVQVAEYYTITKGLGDSTAAERKAAIAGVTDAAASVTSSNEASDATANVVAAVPSKTLTLTTGVDSLKGTAGDDTINGVVQANGLTGSTVSAGDTVVGGAGTDTFNLSVAGDGGGAGYTLQAVNLSAVENIMVTNYDTNASNTTIDTSLMTGVGKVGLFSSSATGDTIFSNMTAIKDAQMSNGSADLTLTYIAGTTGTADTQNLAISATSAGTFTANGVETIAVTGSLANNTLTNIAGSSLTKITVAGDKNFTMSGSSGVATIDTSANTGKTSLVVGANGVAGSTVTLGAGDDTLDMSTTLNALDKIQGGAGTDTIKLSVGNQTVNGGTTTVATSEFVQSGGFEVIDIASTNDAATLNVKDIADVATVKLASNVGLFGVSGTTETDGDVVNYSLNGTAYTTSTARLAATASIDTFEEIVAAEINATTGFTAVSGANTVTVTNTSGSSEIVEFALTSVTGTGTVAAGGLDTGYTNVSVSGMTTQAIDVYGADSVTARLTDSSGTSDAMTINLKSMLADRSTAQTVGTIDIADSIETLNLSSTGMKTQTTTAAVGKTLTALTADAALTALNITGSDNLTISGMTATKLATIDASAHTGDLSLPGVGSLAQTITTGSGNDTFVMGANLTATDVLDGGANTAGLTGTMGKDTVTASGNQGTSVAAAALQLANIETFQLTNTGTASTFIDGTNLGGVGEIALSSAATGAFTFTNMAAGVGLGAGIADDELDAAVTWTLADATGTADALTVDYANTLNTNSSLALTTVGIETLDIVAEPNTAGTNTSTMVNTAMTASTINVTKGVANNILALGNLNKATTTVNAGTLKSQMSLTAATVAAGGSGMTITGPGAAVQTYTLDTKADNVTLTGDLGAVIHVINGGTTASAATSDTFSARINSTSTDLTNVTGFEVLNLTLKDATATGFDDGTKDNGFENASVINILGGNSNSSFTMSSTALLTRDKTSAALAQSIDASTTSAPMTLLFGSDDLDIQTTVKGGSATTDNVSTIIAAGASTTVGNNPTMSGIELLTVSSTDGDADAVINLSNVTGLGRVDATFVTDAGTSIDQIEIDGLAAGVPLRVAGTNAGDNLDVGLASASGTADALSITSTANNAGLNLDAAGIESLTLAQNVAATYDLAGVSPTTGAATTVTLAGSGNVALSALHTGINVIDGSAMGGTLTVQATARDTDVYTITGGVNNDTIAMENAGDVLTAGTQAVAGSDTLEITYSAILGGLTADLSAADQIVNMDGGVNAAVQSGFENIDVSAFAGFGTVITGSDVANVITGSALADRITAGKGNDTIHQAVSTHANSDQINGGAGTDSLTVVGNYAPAADGNLAAVETVNTGTAGAVINLGNQTEGFAINTTAAVANTITGGLGIDTVTNPSAGDVQTYKMSNGDGATLAVDKISNFIVALGEDELQVDLSDMNALVGTLKNANKSGNVAAVATGIAIVTALGSAAGDFGAAASIMVTIAGATAYTEATLEAAIEGNGTAPGLTAGDGILIAYDDTANTYIALLTDNAGTGDGIAFTDITITNILELTGVPGAEAFINTSFAVIT
jgi:S-layer protein